MAEQLARNGIVRVSGATLKEDFVSALLEKKKGMFGF